MVGGNKLTSVLEFTYVGNTISNNGCIYDEIQRRVFKAGAPFGRLRQRLWNNHHVSMGKKLHAFVMRQLRLTMRIT